MFISLCILFKDAKTRGWGKLIMVHAKNNTEACAQLSVVDLDRVWADLKRRQKI